MALFCVICAAAAFPAASPPETFSRPPSPGRARLARAESDSSDSCPKKDRQAEHRSCSRSPQAGR